LASKGGSILDANPGSVLSANQQLKNLFLKDFQEGKAIGP